MKIFILSLILIISSLNASCIEPSGRESLLQNIDREIDRAEKRLFDENLEYERVDDQIRRLKPMNNGKPCQKTLAQLILEQNLILANLDAYSKTLDNLIAQHTKLTEQTPKNRQLR